MAGEEASDSRSRSESFSDVEQFTQMLLDCVHVAEPFPALPKVDAHAKILKMQPFWSRLGGAQENLAVALTCSKKSFNNFYEAKKDTLGLTTSWPERALNGFKYHVKYLANTRRRPKQPYWFMILLGKSHLLPEDALIFEGDEEAEEDCQEDDEEEDAEEEKEEANKEFEEKSEEETCGLANGWVIDFDFINKAATRTGEEENATAFVESICKAPGSDADSKPARVSWNDGTWSKLPMLTGAELDKLKGSLAPAAKRKAKAAGKEGKSKAPKSDVTETKKDSFTAQVLGAIDGANVKLIFRKGNQNAAVLLVGGEQKVQVLAHHVPPKFASDNLAGASEVAKRLAKGVINGDIKGDNLKEALRIAKTEMLTTWVPEFSEEAQEGVEQPDEDPAKVPDPEDETAKLAEGTGLAGPTKPTMKRPAAAPTHVTKKAKHVPDDNLDGEPIPEVEEKHEEGVKTPLSVVSAPPSPMLS